MLTTLNSTVVPQENNEMYLCHMSKELLKYFVVVVTSEPRIFFTSQNAELVEEILQLYMRNYQM